MTGSNSDKGKSKANAIELVDSDTEEEDATPSTSVVAIDTKEMEENTSNGLIPNSLTALMGDRAQMERERLERQRKRRREAGIEDEDDKVDRVVHKKAMTIPARETPDQFRAIVPTLGKQEKDSPLYWNGIIKKSFNHFCSSHPGTSFAQFLLPTTPFNANGLTHAVLATYCADIPWLARLFPKAPIKTGPEITFICLEENDMKQGVHSPLHPDMPNWVRLVVPRKGLTEYTTMHMKFLLLFYEDRLRLLILSGNMVEYDWRDIENTAFIHDFPRLAKGQTEVESDYGNQMKSVLQSLTVPANHPALRLLGKYNMKSTCEARIVASLPTVKPLAGWAEVERAGLGRLSKVVRDIMGGKAGRGVTIEAQGSSMGTYSTRWLQQLHIVCSGLKLDDLLPLPQGAKASKLWAKAVSRKESEAWPPVKLLFPSDKWVKTQSIQGPNGALTFFGKSKQSIEKGFIDLLYQPVSVRGNIMMHHKAILSLRAGAAEETDEKAIIGWAYMGSHNLTQAAWGNISKPKAGAEPQCIIGNWELGIVMPIRKIDLEESQRKQESLRLGANAITWKRPVEKYSKGDIPWDQFNQ